MNTPVGKIYALTETEAPKGFMEDGDGNFRRIDRIKPLDIERDKLSRELFADALAVHDELHALHASLVTKISAFVKSAIDKYDKKLGGEKGNVTL